MLQFWSITESTHKRQSLLMLMARPGKVCPALEKDGKALVAGWSRGCGVTHCGFCVWGCSLFCVLEPLNSHGRPQAFSSGLTFLRGILGAQF